MQIKYTSRNGGDKLGTAPAGAIENYIKNVADLPNGLFAVVDARVEFATQWAAFQRAPAPPPAVQQRVLVLNNINERLPVYTKGWSVSGLVAQNIWVVTDAQVAAGAWSVTVGNNTSNSVAFSDGPAIGQLRVYVAQGPVVISN
jgi:hypothetical protein